MLCKQSVMFCQFGIKKPDLGDRMLICSRYLFADYLLGLHVITDLMLSWRAFQVWETRMLILDPFRLHVTNKMNVSNATDQWTLNNADLVLCKQSVMFCQFGIKKPDLGDRMLICSRYLFADYLLGLHVITDLMLSWRAFQVWETRMLILDPFRLHVTNRMNVSNATDQIRWLRLHFSHVITGRHVWTHHEHITTYLFKSP